MKIKGEGAYGVKSPSVDRCEEEIPIGIHCDAGEMLTKTRSRSQIGICVFRGNRLQNKQK